MIITKTRGSGIVSARFTASGFLKPNHATATIGANTASEVVTSMNIVGISWSVDASGATVARGANTVAKLFGTGTWDLHNNRIDGLGGEAAANTVVTIAGNGTVVLKLHKVSDMVSVY